MDDLFNEIFSKPKKEKYPENHRSEFDLSFDIFEQPEEKPESADVSETLSIDSALRNFREKLINLNNF